MSFANDVTGLESWRLDNNSIEVRRFLPGVEMGIGVEPGLELQNFDNNSIELYEKHEPLRLER